MACLRLLSFVLTVMLPQALSRLGMFTLWAEEVSCPDSMRDKNEDKPPVTILNNSFQ